MTLFFERLLGEKLTPQANGSPHPDPLPTLGEGVSSSPRPLLGREAGFVIEGPGVRAKAGVRASFLFALLVIPLLLVGCSSGETALAYPTARPTKTWTPLPTLTPLATYTPSVTPPPTMPPPPEEPTRAPPPTIPVIDRTEFLAQWNARQAAAANHVPNVVAYSDESAIGGYDGGETECCRWPVSGRITSNVTPNHIALDIATTLGTPVLAADGGRVVAAGWDNTGYGFRVIIDHGQALQTLYAHLSNYPVEVGDEVNQGQMIGRIGSTGNSTGPHLHFEVRYHGRRITPWDLLP